MNTVNLKGFLAAVLLGSVLFLIVCWSAILPVSVCTFIESIVFFGVTYWALVLNEKKWKMSICYVILAILLGRYAVEITTMVSTSSYGALFITFSATVGAILAGICYKNNFKASFGLSIFILLLLSIFGSYWWENYLYLIIK